MNGTALTARQEEILAFITERIKAGWAPTLREIGKEFGIASPNGVICHLRALERKGAIRCGRFAARAIALVGPQDEKDLEILRLKNEVVRLNNVIDLLYRPAEMNRFSEEQAPQSASAAVLDHPPSPETASVPGASADRSVSDLGSNGKDPASSLPLDGVSGTPTPEQD